MSPVSSGCPGAKTCCRLKPASHPSHARPRRLRCTCMSWRMCCRRPRAPLPLHGSSATAAGEASPRWGHMCGSACRRPTLACEWWMIKWRWFQAQGGGSKSLRRWCCEAPQRHRKHLRVWPATRGCSVASVRWGGPCCPLASAESVARRPWRQACWPSRMSACWASCCCSSDPSCWTVALRRRTTLSCARSSSTTFSSWRSC